MGDLTDGLELFSVSEKRRELWGEEVVENCEILGNVTPIFMVGLATKMLHAENLIDYEIMFLKESQAFLDQQVQVEAELRKIQGHFDDERSGFRKTETEG